jgi:putative endonuclease
VASHHAFTSLFDSFNESSVPSEVEGRQGMMYYVYMVQDNFGKLYIGVTQNLEQRLKEHNTHRGAAFTEKGGFKIVFAEEQENLSVARRREIQIKSWRRDKKEKLIKRYFHGLSTKMRSNNDE